ncbi:MAG: hypothetical protein LBU67_01800, partial [Oscillospiraceae bacterium]|nr:hypothetical protein [Oscillospiraceae bacterium]
MAEAFTRPARLPSEAVLLPAADGERRVPVGEAGRTGRALWPDTADVRQHAPWQEGQVQLPAPR